MTTLNRRDIFFINALLKVSLKSLEFTYEMTANSTVALQNDVRNVIYVTHFN